MRTGNSLQTTAALAAILATTVTTTTAWATTQFSTTPTLIPILGYAANQQAGKALLSFDISTFDPATNLFYLGDRSNAGISAWNLNNNTFIGTIGGGQFTGQTGNNSTSGGDGTAVFTTPGPNPIKLVLGGDGNSTVKAYAITGSGTSLANYSSTPFYTVNTNLPNSAGPSVNNRADEMSYDPVHNNVLVANNSATPAPYTTLFNASTGAVISQTVFDGTKGTPDAVGNSIEASIYDAAKDVFWLAIPQIGPSTSDPGGLSEVNATTGAVIATFPFTGYGACSPTGVALRGNQVAIGCAAKGSQTLIFNTDTHALIALPFSGTDAVVYDPAIDSFLLSGANYTGLGGATGPVIPSFAIIDAATDVISQIIATSPGNDHSVDGGNGFIGVPYVGGATSVCPLGCLAVFTQVASVPEPGTLPIVLTAMTGLAGLSVRRRR